MVFAGAFAQRSVEVSINWASEDQTFERDGQTLSIPTFSGAAHPYEKGHAPVYVGRIPLAKSYTASDVRVEVLEYASESRSRGSVSSLPDSLISNNLEWFVGTERGNSVLMVNYIPIEASSGQGGGKVSKFRLIIKETRKATKPKSASFVSNSVLSTGEWHKIGVTEDGIYRINRSFLQSQGINVENLNPQELNIYGNGFGQMPFENSIPRPDDLLPNAIHIEGENDGSFDDDDYILFYAKGPHTWAYDAAADVYNHHKHDYVDTSYYFIGIGTGNPPKRISNMASSSAPPNYDVNSFDAYSFHEVDRENLMGSGRVWYGEKFDVQTTYNFSGERFSFPNIVPGAETLIRADVASRTIVDGSCVFNLTAHGQSDTESIGRVGTSSSSPFASARSMGVVLTNAPSALNIIMSYQKNVPSAIGWLNWISVNTRRNLQMTGVEMSFRDKNTIGLDNVSRFNLTNAGSITDIWDVTDPTTARRIQYTKTGATATFTLATPVLKEFIAFTSGSFRTPVGFGSVANQNLHALGMEETIDMVIVSPAMLMTKAEELADIHRDYEIDPLNVQVVNINHVYNEFSSGMRDVTAIKWLMKMFYDRAAGNEGAMPRYLLLFGDGSYDNRNTTPGNTNLIPTFQSFNSLSPTSSYVSDDYYALLDDDEGEGEIFDNELMDLGVGRIVAKNNQEATSVVNKIRRYVVIPDTPANTNCSICTDANSNLGAWRNIISLVADGTDNNAYMDDSQELSEIINTNTGNYNIERIYAETYQKIATPGGTRFPDANAAIDRRVRNGAFIMNYIGHGGELGWAQARILDVPTILEWDNSIAMPIFVTATCQFARFDDPLRTSAGEYVLLNGNGGGIALLTTTRLVYASGNFQLNKAFFDVLFDRPENEIVTRLGDLSRETKNQAVTSSSNRNFSLLGDPALPVAIPKQTVVVNAITDTLGIPVDTLKALGVARVHGQVQSNAGNVLNNFNGTVSATVYDRIKIKQAVNDIPYSFSTQEDIVFRGNAEVVNGQFQFDFVLPKDISFAMDTTARISLYAVSGKVDATGFKDSLNIGGRDENAVDDGTGPDIEIYLNDENFVFGGYTNDTPTLIANIFDNSGINTVGTGVGHNITATIDEDQSKTIVLNDFYESDLNTYKSGRITYQFDELEEGNHTLKLKVWNVHNNSSETTTEFVVANSEEFAIERLLNYPNPFTTHTEFFFEHNQSCEFLNVHIEVFSVSGKLVKSIVTVSNTDGFRNEPIPWNGRDDFGDRLATGVYVYKISVRNPSGDQVKKFEKLVILN